MFPQLKIEFTKDGNVDIKSASSAGLRWYFRFEYTTIYRVDEDDVSHLYFPYVYMYKPNYIYACMFADQDRLTWIPASFTLAVRQTQTFC